MDKLGGPDPRPSQTLKDAVVECLERVQCGTNNPWQFYLGHRSLEVFNVELGGIFRPRTNFVRKKLSSHRDWDDAESSERSTPALKLLIVGAEGDERKAHSPDVGDTAFMKKLFADWNLPPASMSLLYNKRTTHTVGRVLDDEKGGQIQASYVGMREWVFVWATRKHRLGLDSAGVLFYMAKTWAEVIPEMFLEYARTLSRFVKMPIYLELVVMMTALQSAAKALAKDDLEAFRREFQIRTCLKATLPPDTDLGLMSAQVSWLSARMFRHRDRLAVVASLIKHTQRVANDDKIEQKRLKQYQLDEVIHCTDNLNQLATGLDVKARQLLGQSTIQLSTLANLIARRDQAAALSMATASHRLASISRRDQNIGLNIAKSSRAIAINTLKDSSSMKAIAHVTMIFLPGTFVASFLETPFFQQGHAVDISVSPRVWIFFAITVPLTAFTLACAWVWYRFSERSLPVNLDDNDEMNMYHTQQARASRGRDLEGAGGGEDSDPWKEDTDWGSIDHEFAPSVPASHLASLRSVAPENGREVPAAAKTESALVKSIMPRNHSM